ncbi:TetR/AcrR family transcriptional regulator [Amycolatopsis nigrescens]|uniref:TetR/AcrR family transcriptional regulator n=1 Tax=Amycolatopsis nigrescens TaxID=381445 RepID=UPI000366E231|nr:TetR/AcrR family transcriptional regulator [Amycolatopsis nigrescens]
MTAEPSSGLDLERLPSGRHRLSREDVFASQRGRLLLAVVQVVSEKGYEAATIADIVERAGVSRRVFYEQFATKESGFLAAFELGVEPLLARLGDPLKALAPHDWRGRIAASLAVYLGVLAENPGFARSLHVEMLRAGPAVLARRAALLALFSGRTREMYRRARWADPALPVLPDEVFDLLTGGLDELIREHLRTNDAGTLPDLAESATTAVLVMLGDLPR